MALREKLNSLAAEAANKANALATEAANKANTAIENGRLNLKISAEEKKIDTYTMNLGQLLLDKLDAEETFDDEVMALYASIQASRQVIAQARTEIEANRQPEEDADLSPAEDPCCPNCGRQVSLGDRFCAQCGARLQVEIPQPQEASATDMAAPEAPEDTTPTGE